MKTIFHRYAEYFRNKQYLESFVVSLLFLVGSLIMNFYAGTYAQESQSSPVTDIILSNTRVYDVDGIFVYGGLILIAFIILTIVAKPQRLPFIVKTIALFYIIRSFFISLTHIAVFPTHTAIDPIRFINDFTFSGDLFFSGHTGLPYLMGLIFWENKILRYIFIATSILMGTVVLLAHIHYTIDVFSAFFITYSIFHIAKKIFAWERDLFFKP